MPLHPQAAAFLVRRAARGIRPDHKLSIAEVRARAERPPDPDTLEPVDQIEDRLLPGDLPSASTPRPAPWAPCSTSTAAVM